MGLHTLRVGAQFIHGKNGVTVRNSARSVPRNLRWYTEGGDIATLSYESSAQSMKRQVFNLGVLQHLIMGCSGIDNASCLPRAGTHVRPHPWQCRQQLRKIRGQGDGAA